MTETLEILLEINGSRRSQNLQTPGQEDKAERNLLLQR